MLLILIAVGTMFGVGMDGLPTLALVTAMSIVTIAIIRWNGEEVDYLVDVFLIALAARIGFGVFLHVFELREFFGGDALTYDVLGQQIVDVWAGRAAPDEMLSIQAMSRTTPGWGIHYLTAIIYSIFGQDILAAQSFCGVIGAATAPMVYYCSWQIFNNRRVSRVSSLLVALFPAFIVWSSQLLKDGLITFFLVVIITMVLALQKKFSYIGVIVMIGSLFAIIALRFYIFYLVGVAVVGSFVIGRQASAQNVFRGLFLMLGIGIALTQVGVLQTATENFDKFGNLAAAQRSRADLSKSADSGFSSDADVSTVGGALSTMPTGFAYLMFAPFPWEASSLRQAITIPETFVWWAMIPLMFIGLFYTIKNKLRPALPSLVFSMMLTVWYSIFLGNVGTAYRQRTQIQVFLFMFIAVGWGILLERRENKKLEREQYHRRIEDKLRRAGV